MKKFFKNVSLGVIGLLMAQSLCSSMITAKGDDNFLLPKPTPIVSSEVNYEILCGDLNWDGAVDSGDYMCFRKILLGKERFKLPDYASNDTNKDGEIDSADYTLIRKISYMVMDLNLDDYIDSADYSILRRYLLNIIPSIPVRQDVITPTLSPIPTLKSTPTLTPTLTPTPSGVPGANYIPKAEMVDLSVAKNSQNRLIVTVNIILPDPGYEILNKGTIETTQRMASGSYFEYTNRTKDIKIIRKEGGFPDVLYPVVLEYTVSPNVGVNIFSFEVDGTVVKTIKFDQNGKVFVPIPTMPAIDTSFLEGNKTFALNVFKELNKEEKDNSLFISPISISTAISMAYQGAKGDTAKEIAKALSYNNIDINTLNSGYKNLLGYLNAVDPEVTLNINNSIWCNKFINVNKGFIENTKTNYNAIVENLDFGSSDAKNVINSWISKATNGKINSMINSTNPNDLMYLVNAIYFKGAWKDPFNEKSTYATSFITSKGGKSNVNMMQKKGKILYGSGEGYTAVKLPYGNGLTNMYCILPDEETSIDSFINQLDIAKWNSIKKNMSGGYEVSLELPRFKLEYGAKSLNDSLYKLGMQTAFSPSADFSDITQGVYISDVQHKAIIEVNEKGSEAAAVTVLIMPSSMPDTKEFKANRPFMFAIEEAQSGTILFMGKVCDIK